MANIVEKYKIELIVYERGGGEGEADGLPAERGETKKFNITTLHADDGYYRQHPDGLLAGSRLRWHLRMRNGI